MVKSQTGSSLIMHNHTLLNRVMSDVSRPEIAEQTRCKKRYGWNWEGEVIVSVKINQRYEGYVCAKK